MLAGREDSTQMIAVPGAGPYRGSTVPGQIRLPSFGLRLFGQGLRSPRAVERVS